MDTSARKPSPCYAFGDLTLDIGRRRVRRGGEEIALSKLTFDLLRVLVEAAPNVVGHDEIAERVWGPNRIVTPENLAKRAAMLRQALGDHSEDPCYVGSLRGQGYRLIPEVEAVPLDAATSMGNSARQQPPATATGRSFRTSALGYAVAGIAVLVLALTVVSQWRLGEPVSTTIRTIAVLPYDYMSAGPEQAYLADGLAETIRYRLGQIDNLQIASGASSAAFRDRADDPRSIGARLDVEYLLWVGVRTGGDELRVAAELDDTTDGFSLWSDAFRGELADVFAFEEEIATHVARELSLELGVGPNQLRYGGTDSFEAYNHYLRGREFYRLDALQPMRSVDAFRDAIRIDPDYALAWAWLSHAHGQALRLVTSEKAEEQAIRRMEQAALQAVALAPDNWESQGALGWVYVAKKDWLAANRTSALANDLAIRVGATVDSPYHPTFLHQIGRVEEALGAQEALLRLDPLNTFTSINMQIDLMLLGRYQEALAEYERIKDMPGAVSIMHFWAIPLVVEYSDANPVPPGIELMSPRLAEVWYSPDKVLTVIRQHLDEPGYHQRSELSQYLIFAGYYGEPELAVELMRDMYLGGGYAGFFLIWHPVLSAARRTEGFKQFVRDLGFVELWRQTGRWGDYCHPIGNDDFECV